MNRHHTYGTNLAWSPRSVSICHRVRLRTAMLVAALTAVSGIAISEPVAAATVSPTTPAVATTSTAAPGSAVLPSSGNGDTMVGYTATPIFAANGGDQVDPNGISDGGRVVGRYIDETRPTIGLRVPFAWDFATGEMTDLSEDDMHIRSTRVAPNGTVAGVATNRFNLQVGEVSLWQAYPDGGLGFRVAVAASGAGSRIPVEQDAPVAVNSSGTILLDDFVVEVNGDVTTRPSGGAFGALWDINEAGDIAGQTSVVDPAAASGRRDEPAIWRSTGVESLGAPIPHVDATAAAINDDGDVVAQTTGSPKAAFFKPSGGAFTALGVPGQTAEIVARDINNHDEIVGSMFGSFGEHAFVWSDGRLTDLNDLLALKQESAWRFLSAVGINEKGQITGDAIFEGQTVGYVLDPVNPVVFVHGAGASRLSSVLPTGDPNEVDEGTEIWLNCTKSRRLLSLWPADIASSADEEEAGGKAPMQSAAFGAMRHATCYGLNDGVTAALDGYGTFLDTLLRSGPYREYLIDGHLERFTTDGCDVDQGQSDSAGGTPNLFVFAYDWRRDNAMSAEKLADFMGCVQRMWPGRKVNIVTHSMGSLVARRYVITNGDAPVERVITIGAPWLGAPRLVDVLQTGNFIDNPVANGPRPIIRDIVGSFTAAHQLGANELYSRASEFPIFRELGWDINMNASDNEVYSAAQLTSFLDGQQGGRSTPGTNGATFQGFATPLGGQADWTDDATGTDYTHIVGLQAGTNTIGTVVATNELQCTVSFFQLNCATRPTIRQVLACGDGTVPFVSATRIGEGHDFNAPDADIRIFHAPDAAGNRRVEHTGLTANPAVIDLVLRLLSTHPDVDEAPADRTRLHEPGQDLLPCTAPPAAAPAPAPAPAPMLGRLAGSSAASSMTELNPAFSRRYIEFLGALDVTVSNELGDSTAFPPEGFGEVDGVSVFPSDHDDASLVSLPTSFQHTYNISFTTTDGPLELEMLTGTQQAPTSAVRWIDVDLPDGVLATLTVTPAGVRMLRYDADDDGFVDTVVPPTIERTGNDALDIDPPTINVAASGTGASTRYSVTATDSGSGVDKVLWSLDGLGFEVYDTPVQVPSSTTNLYAFAQDRSGNRSTITSVLLADVPRTPLSTATLTPTANASGWSQGDVVVNVHAVDADGTSPVGSIVWSASGATEATATTVDASDVTIPITASGVTTITFYAIGTDGTNEAPQSIQVRVDLGLPSGTIHTPSVNAVVDSLTTVAGSSADDASGVASVEVDLRNSAGAWWTGSSWGGATWLPTEGITAWVRASGMPSGASLPSGAYRMRMRITDSAGRVRVTSGHTVTIAPATQRQIAVLSAPAEYVGTATSATAINQRGQAVGVMADGVNGRAVVWSRGSTSLIDTSPATPYAQAADIADDGTVVGWAGPASSSLERSAVRWLPDGQWEVLPALNESATSEAHGTNGVTIVGTSNGRPVKWVDGVVSEYPGIPASGTGVAVDINSSGVAVGYSSTPTSSALLWDADGVHGLGTLGGSTGATAINDLGHIVGSSVENSRPHAFFHADGVMRSIHGFSDSFTSTAHDINNLDHVVGEYRTGLGVTHAFLWTESTGMLDLNAMLPPNSGWVLVRANAINENDQIAGFGLFNGEPRGFLMSALHAPIAEDATVEATAGEPAGITLDGWDPDPIDAVTLTVVSAPVHGALSAIDGRHVVYTPSSTYRGADQFTYQVSDGTMLSNIGTIDITVTGDAVVNDRPVADPVSTTTIEDTETPVTLLGHDSDGDALTYAVVTEPAHGTLSGTGPRRSYIPEANWHGVDTFTYTASDAVETSAAATVTITVTAVNDPPVITLNAPATLAEGALGDLATTGSDVDGDKLAYTWVTDGGTLTPDATGAAASLVTGDGPAVHRVAVTVSDGTQTAIAMAEIGVTNVAPTLSIVTPATDPSVAVATALTVTASTGDIAADTVTCTIDWGDNTNPATACSAHHAWAVAGVYTVTVTATDDDGATAIDSRIVTVTAVTSPCSFGQFAAPVDNAPVVNSLKAGATVPVKFTYCSSGRLDIFAANHPASSTHACGSATVDAIEETVTSGTTGLTFDPVTQRYHYNWKTSRAWVGTCRTLILRFDNGTEARAEFRFR